jgi:hypothetical protein
MYKKHILLLAAIFGTLALKAQTNKGDQYLGGSSSFLAVNETTDYSQSPYSSISYTQKTKYHSISVGPVYGLFIANNLDIGVNLGYAHQKAEYAYSVNPYSNIEQSYQDNVYYGALYVRKYFLYNNKIGFRTGLYGEYEQVKSASKYADAGLTPDQFDNYRIQNAGLTFDAVYFPFRRFGLTSTIGTLGYTHLDTQQNYMHDKQDNFGWNLNSGLNVSFFYCFGK